MNIIYIHIIFCTYIYIVYVVPAQKVWHVCPSSLQWHTVTMFPRNGWKEHILGSETLLSCRICLTSIHWISYLLVTSPILMAESLFLLVKSREIPYVMFDVFFQCMWHPNWTQHPQRWTGLRHFYRSLGSWSLAPSVGRYGVGQPGCFSEVPRCGLSMVILKILGKNMGKHPKPEWTHSNDQFSQVFFSFLGVYSIFRDPCRWSTWWTTGVAFIRTTRLVVPALTLGSDVTTIYSIL